MKLVEAQTLANELVSGLKHPAYIAGSIRREVEDIEDIDIIITSPDDWQNIEAFPFEVILGDKIPYLLRKKMSLMIPLVDGTDIQVDFNYSDPDKIGAALLHHTGSARFNVIARVQAKRRGLLLNQYGLFKKHPEGTPAASWDVLSEKGILEMLNLGHHLDPRTRNK